MLDNIFVHIFLLPQKKLNLKIRLANLVRVIREKRNKTKITLKTYCVGFIHNQLAIINERSNALNLGPRAIITGYREPLRL
jgi:hypothetical protein